jgi:phosphate transport system substrate-binding protein
METKTMKTKFLYLLLFGLLLCPIGFITGQAAEAAGMTINGAGASFPYPVYAKWAYGYHQLTHVRINYQSIGSGGGIRQIKAKSVDFGASDAPLQPDELKGSGLIQFPMIMGGVVPVVNIEGIGGGQLKLTPDLLADIFAGKITTWDDPRIVKVNVGVKLPSQGITVVHRSDGSGTTWIFSNYLDKVSKSWHKEIGFGKALDWPTGVGGKGNEGVAAYVRRVNGSVGYVEYAYALQNKMAHVLLQNREGNFVAPTSETFQAAAANADWSHAPGYYLVLTDQPGAQSWPITGASFILLYKKQADHDKAVAILKFFDWCYKKGQKQAEELDYVPMPEKVVDLVEKTWAADLQSDEGSLWKGK